MTSLRLAAYQAQKAGYGSAAEGLARALARNASPVQTIAAIPAADLTKSITATQRGAVATTLPKQGVVPANPKATSATGDRVKIVAEAVAKDSALKGKAGDAIAMLADPDLAGLTGAAVVKSLKAGVTASPPAPAASKAAASTRTAVPAPKAASTAVWDKAIAGMGKPPKLAATKASMTAWDNVIGRMKGAH